MKIKKNIAEAISLLLGIELFYEGVSKLFMLGNYAAFLSHLPYVQLMPSVLSFLIPAVEIALAFGLVFTKTQQVFFLLATVAALLVFVGWICCVYFVARVVSWPFDAIWPRPIWLQKITLALVMCWLALIALYLLPGKPKTPGAAVA